jgi:hypothetical protein
MYLRLLVGPGQIAQGDLQCRQQCHDPVFYQTRPTFGLHRDGISETHILAENLSTDYGGRFSIVVLFLQVAVIGNIRQVGMIAHCVEHRIYEQ